MGITPENLEAKIRGIKAYKGEIRRDPHPRSENVLQATVMVRGSESGFYFAEAFMAQRIFAYAVYGIFPIWVER